MSPEWKLLAKTLWAATLAHRDYLQALREYRKARKTLELARLAYLSMET